MSYTTGLFVEKGLGAYYLLPSRERLLTMSCGHYKDGVMEVTRYTFVCLNTTNNTMVLETYPRNPTKLDTTGEGFYVFLYTRNREQYIKLVHFSNDNVLPLADFHISDWNKQSKVIRQTIMKTYPELANDLLELNIMFGYPESAGSVNMAVWDRLTPVQADRVKRCINSWTRERMKPGGSICNRIINKLLTRNAEVVVADQDIDV